MNSKQSCINITHWLEVPWSQVAISGLCNFTASMIQLDVETLRLSALDVQTNGAVRAIVRKKAALCLLRLLRKAGPDADILQADTWSVKMVTPPCPLLYLTLTGSLCIPCTLCPYIKRPQALQLPLRSACATHLATWRYLELELNRSQSFDCQAKCSAVLFRLPLFACHALWRPCWPVIDKRSHQNVWHVIACKL